MKDLSRTKLPKPPSKRASKWEQFYVSVFRVWSDDRFSVVPFEADRGSIWYSVQSWIEISLQAARFFREECFQSNLFPKCAGERFCCRRSGGHRQTAMLVGPRLHCQAFKSEHLTEMLNFFQFLASENPAV